MPNWNTRRGGRWRVWKSSGISLWPYWYWAVQFDDLKRDGDRPHETGTANFAWTARLCALRALKRGSR